MTTIEAGPRSATEWSRMLSAGVMVGAAAIFMVALFAATGSEKLGYDFRAVYLPAAESVWHGESPYADDDPQATGRLPYVYPPQLAILLVPFTALPVDAAAVFGVLASLAALVGALAIVGVRDIRCFAAVLVWAPGWNSLEMANVSALLALLLAVAWRFRTTVWPLAAALGLAVPVKLFLWPLLAWTAATRRFHALAWALGIGFAVTLLAWALIGFAGLTSFPDQLSMVDFDASYSIVAIAEELGFGRSVGRVLTLVIGGIALVGVVHLARRDDDFGSFTASIAAGLALTPVVWQHYLVLLAVPLAIARPRFSAAWLVPIVLWVSPRADNGDVLQVLMPALVAALLVAIVLSRPDHRGLAAESDG
jgi:alpha-1,2-mannosyltransferase